MSLGWKTNDGMSCFLGYFWVMKKEDTMYNTTGRYKRTTNLNNSTQIQLRSFVDKNIGHARQIQFLLYLE